jgi:hypothetical protein
MSEKTDHRNLGSTRDEKQDGAWEPNQANFFYYEKTATCERHDGVKVTYEISKHNRCPLCAALNKIAYYETSD